MIGPDVEQLPATGGSTVDADVYRDPMRFELEREPVLRRIVADRRALVGDPEPDDWLTYEGHGETVDHHPPAGRGARRLPQRVPAPRPGVRPRRDVGLRAAASPARGTAGCTTPRACVVGVPEREDFDPEHLEGLRAPPVAAEEWGGWIWINLAGPDDAPALAGLARARHRRPTSAGSAWRT